MKNLFKEILELVEALPKEKTYKVYLIDGKWQRLPSHMIVL